MIQNSALTHLIPVNPLHWDWATYDSFVSFNHSGNVVCHKLLVSVNKDQVACILHLHLHEVVRYGISATLHQTLVPKEYAR
jgi:hypothetical protein